MTNTYKIAGKYFCGNEISAYGQEHNRLDYDTFAKAFDAVLNNNIMEKGWSIGNGWELVNGSDYDEENDEYTEVFQWYIVSDGGARMIQDYTAEEARCFGYCDTLSPMAAGKARNALYKPVMYKGKAVKKKDFIKMLADNGGYTAQEKFFSNYKSGKSPCYCIIHEDESFYTVSKTEYNLFKFLTKKEV